MTIEQERWDDAVAILVEHRGAAARWITRRARELWLAEDVDGLEHLHSVAIKLQMLLEPPARSS